MKTKNFYFQKFIISLFVSFSFVSCTSFIQSAYKKMDEAKEKNINEEGVMAEKEKKLSLQKKAGISSEKMNYLPPTYKRSYLPNFENAFKSSDFEDHANPISLWHGEGRDNSLYGLKTKKKLGDILTLQVAEDLFNEINYALTRAGEIEEGRYRGQRALKESSTSLTGDENTANPTATNAQNTNEASDNGLKSLNEKVYDKISCKVIAEPDNDTFIVKGMKSFFFQKKRRTIEIEATIAKKDINFDDSVLSNNINESKIKIIK